MLKGIALTIKGWFRGQAEAATDLRYAGREHIHEVKQGIEQVRDQRNEVAAKGILLEGRIATLEEQVANDIEAVKHWNASGDEGKKARAYTAYQQNQKQLDKLRADKVDIENQVADLDAQIVRLENDTEDASDDLTKAATQQVLGKAATKVESVHKNIKSGPLAGAIERSKEQGAKAEAQRRQRTAGDNSDLYSFQQSNNVLSMDELLGNNNTQVEDKPAESLRGKTAHMVHVDEAPFQSASSVTQTHESSRNDSESSSVSSTSESASSPSSSD